MIASTVREFSAQIPMTETIEEPSGQMISRRSASFFGLRLPLTLTEEPGEGWEKESVRTVLRANGVELPVSWLEETWREVSVRERLLTPEEALEAARDEVERQKSALKGLTVLNGEESISQENGVLYYTLHAQCEEDIAVETEILVNSPN